MRFYGFKRGGDFMVPFGSHKGKTVSEIYKYDPKYVLWLRDETIGDAQLAAEEFIHAESKRIIEEAKAQGRVQ